MAKKKFTQLPVAGALIGDEIVAVVQSGTSKQTTAQDIADLAAAGGGSVESVTGDGLDNTDPANPIISFPTLSEAILKGGQIDTSRDVTVTGTAVLSIQSDNSSLLFLGNGGIELDLGSDADGDMFRRAPGSGQIERRTPSQVLTDIGAQAALGFTPENVTNKATDFTTVDNTKYPTVQAVQTEIMARVAGLAWKNPVTCATTANITLSGEQTIDGVATSNVRVLVKNQSTASQNGIYVSASGAWSRSSDADTGTELHGATTTVQEGTSNANTTWNQTADGITLGSTSISWSQLGTSVPDASSSTKGIAKLYPSTSLGTNTDGAPDQNAVKVYVDAAITTATPDASETVKGKIEIATQAEVTTGTDDVRGITPLKLATETRGVQDLFIPAAAMWPRVTGGCSALTQSEIATSLFNIQSLDFDQTTQEFAQCQIVLPRKWNNGTVTAVVYWTATAGSGTVQWGISGGAYSDDDALSTALGTAQTADDTLITTNDLHISPATSAITIAGTPADADFLAFQISRNPASDTLSADAKLLGISIRITTDASKDA